MKRVLVFGIALLLAGLLVLVLTGGGDPGGAPQPELDSDEVERVGVGGGGGSPRVSATGPGAISGVVWRGGAAVPAELELRNSGGKVSRTGAAGLDGAFRFPRVALGEYVVVATADDGARGSAVARIISPGEHVRADPRIPGGGLTLRGRAVCADGSPFRGEISAMPRFIAWMHWLGDRSPTSGPVAVAADGTFEIPGLWPDNWWLVLHGADGVRTGSGYWILPAAGEILVRVSPGGEALTGEVLSESDGSPIEGASVTARVGRGLTGASSRTVTDADGRFSLPSPAMPASFWSRVILDVSADGFSSLRVQTEPRAGPVQIRLARPTLVEGRVTDSSGAPAPGVSVFAMKPDGNLDDALQTTSGADGRYRLEGIPVGRIMVFARGNGLISVGMANAETLGANPLALVLRSGERREVDLAVIAAGRAIGTVSRQDGSPVVGATVRAAPVDPPLGSGPTPGWLASRTATASDGSFALSDLVPGARYLLKASAPGEAEVAGDPFTIESGGEVAVDLRFGPSFFVPVMVVVAESGEPVAGAHLQVRNADDPEVLLTSGTTIENGIAVLGPQSTPRIQVYASHPDCLRGAWTDITAPEAGEEPPRVELVRGLAISGTVRFPDGSPAHGGRVSVSGEGSSSSPIGPDGRFRASALPRGNHFLSAGANRGGRHWSAGCRVDAGASDVALVLSPGEEDVRLANLRILDPEGEPVGSAHVARLTNAGTVEWNSTGAGFTQTFSEEYPVTLKVCDARGRNGERLGSALLELGSQEGGELLIRLPASSKITGRIIDSSGGPLRGILLEAFPAHRLTADVQRRFQVADAVTWTGADGRFALDGLGDFEYRLNIAAPPNLMLPPEMAVNAGTSDLEIRLEKGLTIDLTFLDWRGEPVEGVHASISNREVHPPSRRETVTGPDGVARFLGIDPSVEEYSLFCSAPGERTDLYPAKFFEAPFKPRDRVFKFDKGLTVTGVVRDGEGRGVPKVNVEMQLEGRMWRGVAWTRADGSFETTALAPGPVRLRASLNRRPGEPVDVAAGDKGVEFVVEVPGEFEVRILNWRPEYGGNAYLLQSGESISPVRPTADGGAVFKGVSPAKSATLFVQCLVDGLVCLRKDIDVGSGDVEVRLVPGESISGRVIRPAGADEGYVIVYGPGFTRSTGIGTDGRFEVPCLPRGVFEVHAICGTAGRTFGSIQTTAGTGSYVEIDLSGD